MVARSGRVIGAVVALLLTSRFAGAQSSQTSEKEDPKPPPRAVRMEFDKRPIVKVGDSLRIGIRTRLQTDFDNARDPGAADSVFEVAKRRVGIAGELSNRITFEVEREIATSRPWRDVFVGVKIARPLQIQAGRFKMPASAEQLTSIVDLPFIDRSLIASTLAPGRDTGVIAHGKVGGRRLEYQIGLFHQDGDTARRGSLEGAGQTIGGRVTTSAGVKHLTLGASATRGRVPEGLNGLAGRTASGFRFFQPVYVNGRRLRVGAEAGWAHDRYQLNAEWLQLRDQRLGQALDDSDLSDAVASGWYVSGAWTLARGTRPEGKSRRFFDRGAGDLEVAARIEAIAFGSAGRGDVPLPHPRAESLLENRVEVVTFGFNWHLNRWIKVLNHLSREHFSDPERRPRADQDHVWHWALRLQWAM